MSLLSQVSVHAWMQEHRIKTERGETLDFKDHPFLFDIYRDLSPLQVIMKPAQVGLTLLQMIKLFWVVWAYKLEVIYTMPTDSDVSTFVGARMNSLIRQNSVMQALTHDRDTIETKKIGESMVYFKGTWTKKAAISVPADLLIHDELDASNLQIIEDYETRLRHSKYKWRWLFSHPSFEGVGAHKYWQLSDQKHWFITCGHCKKEQYMDWPDSVCFERMAYVCKYCDEVLTDDMRRHGRWVQKFKDREWSGYWINSMMCIWITAKEIINNYYTKDPEYFYTKVLGLPYIGEGNKIPESHFTKNLIDEPLVIGQDRVIIGLDTGTTLWYTCGTRNGVFKWGHASGYEEIEDLLRKYPRSVLVCDQGGDLIAPRKLREKYQGRVFLCHYEKDRKTMQLIRWGKEHEEGNVKVDRNRMISLIVGELDDQRYNLHGTKEYWSTLMDHAKNMYREKEENEALGTFDYVWKRSGPDHLCFVAGSMIMTDMGEKPIQNVMIGDMVLTRKGYKRVYRSWLTRENAEVMDVFLSNGRKLTGTPDHKIMTNGQWIELHAIHYGDKIETCPKQLSSMGSSLEDRQNQNVEQTAYTTRQVAMLKLKVLADFTKKYGSLILEKSLKVLPSITKTITLSIMRLAILSASKLQSTCQNIQKNVLQTQPIKSEVISTSIALEGYHMLGDIPKKVKSGIVSMPIRALYWLCQKSLIALSVAIKALQEAIKAVSSASQDVVVVGTLANGEKSNVYNISVEDEHEYYVNGVLAKNCHAFLYMRVGMDRFAQGYGAVIGDMADDVPTGIEITPSGRMPILIKPR